VDPAQASDLKTALVGVPLPARQPELLEYAVQRHAGPPLLDALRSLSDQKEYGSLDDVLNELLNGRPAADTL
jgi:hypothetical protein